MDDSPTKHHVRAVFIYIQIHPAARTSFRRSWELSVPTISGKAPGPSLGWTWWTRAWRLEKKAVFSWLNGFKWIINALRILVAARCCIMCCLFWSTRSMIPETVLTGPLPSCPSKVLNKSKLEVWWTMPMQWVIYTPIIYKLWVSFRKDQTWRLGQKDVDQHTLW